MKTLKDFTKILPLQFYAITLFGVELLKNCKINSPEKFGELKLNLLYPMELKHLVYTSITCIATKVTTLHI